MKQTSKLPEATVHPTATITRADILQGPISWGLPTWTRYTCSRTSASTSSPTPCSQADLEGEGQTRGGFHPCSIELLSRPPSRTSRMGPTARQYFISGRDPRLGICHRPVPGVGIYRRYPPRRICPSASSTSTGNPDLQEENTFEGTFIASPMNMLHMIPDELLTYALPMIKAHVQELLCSRWMSSIYLCKVCKLCSRLCYCRCTCTKKPCTHLYCPCRSYYGLTATLVPHAPEDSTFIWYDSGTK